MMLSCVAKDHISSIDLGTQIKGNEKQIQQSTLRKILLIIHVNKTNTLSGNWKLYLSRK